MTALNKYTQNKRDLPIALCFSVSLGSQLLKCETFQSGNSASGTSSLLSGLQLFSHANIQDEIQKGTERAHVDSPKPNEIFISSGHSGLISALYAFSPNIIFVYR